MIKLRKQCPVSYSQIPKRGSEMNHLFVFKQKQFFTCQVKPASPCAYRSAAAADGCLLNSREKGSEHTGHTVWVASSVSQA